nr:ASN_HP1_G0005030.mRNA.1.CDS.1 [Saccharomyces cerevisiae]
MIPNIGDSLPTAQNLIPVWQRDEWLTNVVDYAVLDVFDSRGYARGYHGIRLKFGFAKMAAIVLTRNDGFIGGLDIGHKAELIWKLRI